MIGRKNNPGMAFNPITLEYDTSVQGEILRNRDDQSKVSLNYTDLFLFYSIEHIFVLGI
jgi:hypothetical protein